MSRRFDLAAVSNVLARRRRSTVQRRWASAPTAEVEDLYYLHRVIRRRSAAWDLEGELVTHELYRRKREAGEALDPFPRWRESQRLHMWDDAARSDGLLWPRRDALKWLHLASVGVCG